MNKMIYFALMFLVLSACSDEERLPADVTLEVRNFIEETVFTFGEEQGVYLWSTKSWADKGVTKVEYVVDPTVLDKYNKEQGTSLKLLPESCYRAEQSSFEVSDDLKHAKFKVLCSPEKMIEAGGMYDSVEYALPYRILVNGNPVDDRYGSVLVGFRVLQPLFKVETGIDTVYVSGNDDFTIKYPYEINFDNQGMIALNFSMNSALVDDFNALYNTEYAVCSAACVSWDKDSAVLNRKETKKILEFNVVASDIPKGAVVLPMQLVIDDPHIGVDPKNDRKYFLFYNDEIDQTNWTPSTCRTWQGNASYLTDGLLTWNWVLASEAPEYYAMLSLKDEEKVVEFTGVTMYVVQNNNWNKGQKKADILVSMDGDTWEKVATYEFKLEDNHFYYGPQRVRFPKTLGRHIKIIFTEWYDVYIGFAELIALGEVKDR